MTVDKILGIIENHIRRRADDIVGNILDNDNSLLERKSYINDCNVILNEYADLIHSIYSVHGAKKKAKKDEDLMKVGAQRMGDDSLNIK